MVSTLAIEAEKIINAIRESRPKLSLTAQDLRILVDVVKLSEEIKPSQHAKRVVFAKHGVIGTPRDRLLTAIFYDIMKRLGIIDKVIKHVTGVESPLILDPWLRAGLRVAVGLLLFHRLSPSSKHKLRFIVADYISAKTHPYAGMYYWRVFDAIDNYRFDVKCFEELLELKYLLPAWFIKRMKELLGDKEAEELFRALNEKPLISVRVNTLKASVEEVVEELRKEGKKPIVSSRVPVVIKFEGPYDFDHSRLYLEGKIIIQDEAAVVAGFLLGVKPGMTVVDLCAAPGGKTTHIAELMKNKGVIHAFDIDEPRIKRMRMLLRRMGITIVRIHKRDARTAPKVLGESIADRVLVDPPCSSTGTIAKNPELRWRIREDGLEEIVTLQKELIEAGLKLLKPGGRLLYTVCSLLPEEGEYLIKEILEEYKDEVELVKIKGPYDESKILPGTMRAWPHRHGTTGFFYALLERKK